MLVEGRILNFDSSRDTCTHFQHSSLPECINRNCSTKQDNKISLFCSVCKEEHLGSSDNQPWFPNYSIMQLVGNTTPKSKYICPVHQQDRSYFCFDDQSLVCIYCAYHEHKQHECQHIDEARQKVETSLQDVKQKVVSRASELERHVKLLSEEYNFLKTQKNQVTQVVNDFYSQIEEVLHRQKEMLLSELNVQTDEVASGVDTRMRSAREISSICDCLY